MVVECINSARIQKDDAFRRSVAISFLVIGNTVKSEHFFDLLYKRLDIFCDEYVAFSESANLFSKSVSKLSAEFDDNRFTISESNRSQIKKRLQFFANTCFRLSYQFCNRVDPKILHRMYEANVETKNTVSLLDKHTSMILSNRGRIELMINQMPTLGNQNFYNSLQVISCIRYLFQFLFSAQVLSKALYTKDQAAIN